MDGTNFIFDNLTDEESRALDEAARYTCAFEPTWQTGDQA